MGYGERLQQAPDLAGASRDDLARALGVTVQAVGQVITGKTLAFKAKNSAQAAQFLAVSAHWLATGEGLPRNDMEAGWERRRRKLERLVSLYGKTSIAAQAGLNSAFLDQVLKEVLLPAKADGTRSPRKLGDQAARRIEAALALPRNWLDAEDDLALQPVSDAAMELARRYDRMSRSEQDRLQRVIEALRERGGPSGAS